MRKDNHCALTLRWIQRPHTILNDKGRKCQKPWPKSPHALNSQACDANAETMIPARPLPHTQRLQCFCHLPSASSHLRSTLSKMSQTSGRHVSYFWRRTGYIVFSIHSSYRNSRTCSKHTETRTGNLKGGPPARPLRTKRISGWYRFVLDSSDLPQALTEFRTVGREADHSH
jgi:hypothetical protein